MSCKLQCCKFKVLMQDHRLSHTHSKLKTSPIIVVCINPNPLGLITVAQWLWHCTAEHEAMGSITGHRAKTLMYHALSAHYRTLGSQY